MTLPYNSKVKELQQSIGVGADGLISGTETTLGETLQRLYDLHVHQAQSESINTIIDINGKNGCDIPKLQSGGITAIIHKATQGRTYRDSEYLKRRSECKRAGFLWGCYHFASTSPVEMQVMNFLDYAQPEEDELVSLDWEPEQDGGAAMTLAQAEEFVTMIFDKLGRWPVVYSGYVCREALANHGSAILANCPLWYARYADQPYEIPHNTWSKQTLWQYTDGDSGMQPHKTPGSDGADRNIYEGSLQDMKIAWPF